MIILTKATITSDDSAAETVLGLDENNGQFRVTHNGDQVTITKQDRHGRYARVDTLIEATSTAPKKGSKGSHVFEGLSLSLMQEMGLHPDDARLVINVAGTEGCCD